ncbi:ketopantoate reductase family protein [Nocardiopsis baichengensis]|uniref:ketopantoate reductase family protein n=1 Tax=Nocardiopsis baichengensis TaxID=280240 RepID=UPI000347E466|nr:2-dehydropantoate 2-reductase [Nocardiopsis baichengensis]
MANQDRTAAEDRERPRATPEGPGRIEVLAPGGVGGLLAGLLHRDGHDVTVVATEPTARRIDERGLRVDSSAFGDFTVRVPAAPRLESAADVLVIGCKATALDDALERIPAEHVRGALIVPLLNGFEHMSVLRERFPESTVVGSAIRVESTRVAPGHIVQSSPFAAFAMATEPAPGPRAEALLGALQATGLSMSAGGTEDDVLWRKMHFLLPTALVCTHAESPMGGARTGERRSDLLAVAGEVEKVAARRGVSLDTDHIVRTADAIPAETKPSMLRDREAGRPMEVDALGGALLRAAEAAGVEVPVTARIVADLERVDAANRAAARSAGGAGER